MYVTRLVVVCGLAVAGCTPPRRPANPVPVRDTTPPVPARPPAPPPRTLPDSVLEQRVGRLELRLLEKEAQVEELQARLDAARQEVVRAMAKLQTLASRAEAASGMAEAEVALQPLTSATGQQAAPEIAQATALLRMSTAEFDKQNYGGALYLANQAKNFATAGRGRLTTSERESQRPGEVPFAVPLRLQAAGRGNVRDGPGTTYRVLFRLDPGTPLTGYSYIDDWLRVADETGRGGWVFRTLVARRGADTN